LVLRGALRSHCALDPLEVDHPVPALVAAALMARRDAAVAVPAAGLLDGLEQALLGLGLRDLVELGDRHEAPARRSGLVLAQCHQAWAPSKISIDSPWRIWTIAF